MAATETAAKVCKTVELPGCPVTYVVVYSDRAEVTREIELTLEAGDHEIQLNNISKSLDKDSLHVDGIGAASITEVSYQEIPLTTEEDIKAKNNEEISKLQGVIDELVNKKDVLMKKKEQLQEQEELLKMYSKKLISSSKGSDTGVLVNTDTVEGVISFLDTYETSYTAHKMALLQLEEEIEQAAEKLLESQAKLRDYTGSDVKAQAIKQPVIGILLNVKEKGKIKLMVSYVVTNASWSPKYDLRVNSLQRSMLVSYFGLIKQNTGEDWVNAKVSLSTAAPNIGGTAPELKTLKINLIHPVSASNYRGIESEDVIRSSKPMGGFGKGADGSTYKDKTAMMSPQAHVSEGLSSSVFEIVAMATIPSDGTAHKVSISSIPLTPIFEYDTVPKLSQHAFLKAKVKNESSYHMLGGTANVFLDHAFVTTTSIPNVSPQEEFSCSLGVDNSIKVVYKPVHKYREESGIITVLVMYTYTQVTHITNNRSEPAIINYTDQIPLSKDTKLKVSLVEPVIGKVKPGNPPPNPNLTSQNAITWRAELHPGETKVLTVKYTVEYPKNKEVDGL